MNIVKNVNNNEMTFSIDGRIDTMTSPILEKSISEISNDIHVLIFDMAKVTYISSAGLRVILSAHKKMSKIGKLELVNVCETVLEVFDITGFSSILNIK